MSEKTKEKPEFKLPVKKVTGDNLKEKLTENAYQRILPARYLLKDEDGETIETPKEMFMRVAENIAQPDKNHSDANYQESKEEFYNLLTNLKFIPNSPTLMNAGTEIQQLSACFVAHPKDEMESIFSTVEDAAKIFQSGGGMGYPFHLLRPKGDIVKSTGGIASGPLTFQQVFDTMCGTIKQGGCLSQDSRIMTSKGYIPIREIHNGRPNSDIPAKALVKTRDGFNQAVQTHESGKMDIHTLITEDGYKLKSVYEHPVLSINNSGKLEFKRVDQLEKGDIIIYDQSDKLFNIRKSLKPFEHKEKKQNREIKIPEKLTDKLARFTGLIWIKGEIDKTNKKIDFQIEENKPERKWLKETLELWGLTNKNNLIKIEKDKSKITVKSSELIDWIEENNLIQNRKIPEPIYRSPPAIPAFLGGLTTKAKAKEDKITYSSLDIVIAEKIQELLLLCGIPSKITPLENEQKKENDENRFEVKIYQGKPTRRFTEKIPHFLKQNHIELNTSESKEENENKVYFADKLVNRLLNDKYGEERDIPKDIDKYIIKKLNEIEKGEKTPSRTELVNILKKIGIENVPELKENHLYQKIDYNEEDDKAPIADIEIMNGAHEFVASNAVVHNKRRGAQMGIMRVDHPDILRFIVSKRKEGNLSNFNISVGITEEFMDAVKNDEKYRLINPRTEQTHIVTEKTAEFYNKDEEWWPEAQGSDTGKDENFWRDFGHTFDEEVKKHNINLEPGEEMKLPARFIWKTLVDGAWRNGEPGLFMYDQTNKMHSFDVEKHPEHRIEATNPCVTGDTYIHTNKGLYTAKELYEKNIPIEIVVDSRKSKEKTKKASRVYKTGVKDIIKIETKEGLELRLTEEHRVMTEKGWKEAGELDKGDQIHILDREGEFGEEGTEEEGRLLGQIVTKKEQKTTKQNTELKKQINQDINKIAQKTHKTNKNNLKTQKTTLKTKNQAKTVYSLLKEKYSLKENKPQVPEKLFKSSKKQVKGFLQTLFTINGSIELKTKNNISIQLPTTNKPLLKDVQKLLLNLGIKSKIHSKQKTGIENKPNKPNNKQTPYKLEITNNDLYRFQEKIGFIQKNKTKKLRKAIKTHKKEPEKQKHIATVESIEKDGKEAVYDLTEPETNSFIANGFVVHNCGEQPLENYEACNLGHINLSLLVEDKGDGEALTYPEWKKENSEKYNLNSDEDLKQAIKDYLQEALDMEEFERVARAGTRFLDNVITMNEFPLEKIEEKVEKMRKIGLGLMGFAQLLIQLGIRYGSQESIEAAKEIQRLITKFSILESNKLARNRGKFPEWSDSKWANPTEYPEWFKRHSGGLDPEKHSEGLALRNHNTTSIAPTGTTSMIANTSGGCEPIYSLAYFKNVAKDIQGEDMLVEFDDYFIKTLEANKIDVEKVKEAAIQKMENNEWEGVDSIKDEILPPSIKQIFITTDRVKPEEHVDIQAAFQHYNHSGISKTCNFPNTATKKDVEKAYMRAYEKGVKGMTVYRDGSREIQVMKTNKKSGIDIDKQDLIAKLIEEFGGIKQLLESKEFKQTLKQKDIQLEKQEKPSLKTLQQLGLINEEEEGGQTTSMSKKGARERPKVVEGATQEIETPYGDLYVTINEDKHGPFEVFARIGKAGGYTQSFTEALGRMISLSLRTGASGEEVIKQLDDIRSPKISWDKGTKIYSVPDAIAEAMKRHLDTKQGFQETVDKYGQKEIEEQKDNETDTTKIIKEGINPECPECGGMLTLQEGCKKCPSCGWSEC